MKPALLTCVGLLLALGPCLAGDDPAKDKAPKDKEKSPLPIEKLVAQHKELVPALIEALKDPDAQVRQTAAYTLATIGKDAVPALIEALANQDKELRANAAYILGQFGKQAQDALPVLVKLLKDADPDVRQRASYAINRILADSVPPPSPVPAPMPAAPEGRAAPSGAVWQATYQTPARRQPDDPGLLPPRTPQPPGPLRLVPGTAY
jgi:hypothetical protein